MRKKQADEIRDRLRRTGAPSELKVKFERLAEFTEFLRRRLLVGNDVENDLKKIYRAAVNAISELTLTGNLVLLKKIAERFEDVLPVPQGYPESNAERSRIASRILRSLGLVDWKRGTGNYTLFIISSCELENLQKKMAAEEPVGELIAFKQVEDWLRQTS